MPFGIVSGAVDVVRRWISTISSGEKGPLGFSALFVLAEELGREAIPVPDIICKPLPANPRRKALIVGINYAGGSSLWVVEWA